MHTQVTLTATKAKLKAELAAMLTETLAALRRAHIDATEAATHEEAKPENDKDTRAVEQSYLARGQAMRIEALANGLMRVESTPVEATDIVKLGALVAVSNDAGEILRLWVAPDGGGTTLSPDVKVVTLASPLGTALAGKQVDDEVTVSISGRVSTLVVVKVE